MLAKPGMAGHLLGACARVPVGLDTEIEAWGTERGTPEAQPEVRAEDNHVAEGAVVTTRPGEIGTGHAHGAMTQIGSKFQMLTHRLGQLGQSLTQWKLRKNKADVAQARLARSPSRQATTSLQLWLFPQTFFRPCLTKGGILRVFSRAPAPGLCGRAPRGWPQPCPKLVWSIQSPLARAPGILFPESRYPGPFPSQPNKQHSLLSLHTPQPPSTYVARSP